jgi:hypothetical protein
LSHIPLSERYKYKSAFDLTLEELDAISESEWPDLDNPDDWEETEDDIRRVIAEFEQESGMKILTGEQVELLGLDKYAPSSKEHQELLLKYHKSLMKR